MSIMKRLMDNASSRVFKAVVGASEHFKSCSEDLSRFAGEYETGRMKDAELLCRAVSRISSAHMIAMAQIEGGIVALGEKYEFMGMDREDFGEEI